MIHNTSIVLVMLIAVLCIYIQNEIFKVFVNAIIANKGSLTVHNALNIFISTIPSSIIFTIGLVLLFARELLLGGVMSNILLILGLSQFYSFMLTMYIIIVGKVRANVDRG